ncbi:hypothetical protein RRF57_009556 [Xylaria bambusicola]|uniref:Uncharacterized protein n=1 Tax=Xylaria bambusicola TaxID=326684 RepID=A0AAN7Z7X7_9PEZI
MVEKLKLAPRNPGPMVRDLAFVASLMSSWFHAVDPMSEVEGSKDQIVEPLEVEQFPAYTSSDPLSAREGTKAVPSPSKKGKPEERVLRESDEAIKAAEMSSDSKSTESCRGEKM